MSFLDLKGKSGGFMQDVQKSIEAGSKAKKETDDTSFYPQLSKEGNGFAVIRFLPPCEGESVPWVQIFSHGFKGPNGRWYIENCPTTIKSGNDVCPACDSNGELWKTGEEGQAIVRRWRKRKMKYVSNVYVVKDPKNPEREGKVFKFMYGVKIFDKIKAHANPQFEGQDPVNPFDLWAGADFNLKIQKKDGQTNYDLSGFEPPRALSSDDAELEAIWKSCYPLQEIIAEDKFKDYATLNKRLVGVIGGATQSQATPAASAPASPVKSAEPAKADSMDMPAPKAGAVDDFFKDL